MPPMPLPDAIQALLDSSDGGSFNPAQSRKEYDDYRPVWQLYLDLYELDMLKLKGLVEKHNDKEDDGKYKLRQTLATIYNLVPTIINLSRNYIFSEYPTIEAKDARLQAFIDDCDGRGTNLADWIKMQAMPLSQVFGWVDVLVQNPNTAAPEIKTAADAHAADIRPSVIAFTPLDRVNWSCDPQGGYNWVRFRDDGDEGTNPFAAPQASEAYITVSGGPDALPAFWFRSVQKTQTSDYEHDGDFCPTKAMPIASLFHQRSVDRTQRHHGISKLAVIASLTKSIIQILSWTTEDVLANLAIICLPTKDGKYPKDDQGNPIIFDLNAFSILTYPVQAGKPPSILQGDSAHIAIKLKLIELHLREIMRVANLMVVAGDANVSMSGVQGVVERNELFRELKDTAQSLDAFTAEILAHAMSWIDNKPHTPQEIRDAGATINFFKGPFTVEPLKDVITNAQQVIDLMRDLSPSAVEAVMKAVARAAITGDDKALEKSLKELEGSGETPPVFAPPAPASNSTAVATGEEVSATA